MLRKIKKIPGFIRGLKKIKDVEHRLSASFKEKHHLTPVAAPLVLVQCVEDPYYFGLFGQIVSSLRVDGPVRAEQFVLRSANVGEADSWGKFIGLRLVLNKILNQKWTRLYSSFCDDVAYQCSGWDFSIADFIDLFRAHSAWKSLSNAASLERLEIRGIPVGDLVNDTFLRFKPAPTVDIEDKYLFLIIWQAYCDVRRAHNYFSNSKVNLYLTSYSTYIQHGIPVRIALRAGVKVFSFGNYQEFSKQLSTQDWMHTKEASAYAKEFSLLDNPSEKLTLADKKLSARLAGATDAATAYMKESAYREIEKLTVDVNGAVVIFLHDFFDSPNVYYNMVFSDFWQWACFTIEALEKARVPFVIKPHPNQVGLSGEVLHDLMRRYPDACFISSKITNKQLVDGGVICAVTAYGTVSHEMAYLGVPSVTCARHPHIAFDFCVTATNRVEYGEALASCLSLLPDKPKLTRESLVFYYMHNLNYGTDECQFLDAVSVFRKRCADAESGDVDMDFPDELGRISEMPGFQTWIAKWHQILGDPPRIIS